MTRFGDEVVKLVWENRQVLVREMPTRTSPTCVGYSSQNEKETQPTKRTRLGSVDPILGDTCLHDDHIPEWFPGLDLSNLNISRPSFAGSQVVPINKSADLQEGNASGRLVTGTEVPHLTEAWNSQINESSQKPDKASSPRNMSTVDAYPGPSPTGGVLSNSKLHQPYFGPDQNHLGIGLKNFSLFSRHQGSGPTRPTIYQSSLGLELKSSNNEEPPAGANNPVESRGKKPAACSFKSVGFFHDQQDTMATKKAVRSTTRPAEESAPDEQSEAVVPKGNAPSKRCLDPACGPTSCQAAYSRSKGKRKMSETENSMDQVAASATSICSREASNDPTYLLKRRDEDTEGMEFLSENDEEEQVGTSKGVSSWGKGAAKRRRTEVLNASERRRRDKIGKKIRALKDLIPGSSEMDKVSVLDKAIEYLKTLQLQVQMMSMAARIFIPPMMFPSGMQHIQGPYLPHFPAMGLGFGMRMHHMGVGCSPSPFSNSVLLGLAGQGPTNITMPGEQFFQMMGMTSGQGQSDTLPGTMLDPEWPPR